MLLLILCICFIGTKVHSQYVCVPMGLCPPSTGNVGIPDIRIVTPGGGSLCPIGMVPCVTNSTTSSINCGVRNIGTPVDVDGTSAPGAFPWQAYMINQTGQYFGSGVLVDQYNLLTAAHKVAGALYNPSSIRIAFGVWDPRSMGTVSNRTATSIVIHPNYNPNTLFNNIAVVRLSSPVAIGQDPTVGCATLPTAGSSYVGRSCIVAGWGQNDINPIIGASVGPMKQVTLPIVDYPTCRAAHSSPSSLGSSVDMYLDPVGELCAGGQANKDACTNDGGAPLMCYDQNTAKWTAVGLVIWGKGCGNPGLYGVYTNIANYRNWIDSTLANLNAASGK